jgi:light-harvesting complex 1 beta chain
MIFVLIFCVFMALAVVGQLLALNWRTWLPGAEGSTTTLVGVKSAVYTVISQLS